MRAWGLLATSALFVMVLFTAGPAAAQVGCDGSAPPGAPGSCIGGTGGDDPACAGLISPESGCLSNPAAREAYCNANPAICALIPDAPPCVPTTAGRPAAPRPSAPPAPAIGSSPSSVTIVQIEVGAWDAGPTSRPGDSRTVTWSNGCGGTNSHTYTYTYAIDGYEFVFVEPNPSRAGVPAGPRVATSSPGAGGNDPSGWAASHTFKSAGNGSVGVEVDWRATASSGATFTWTATSTAPLRVDEVQAIQAG
jgi:hypothetical protein